MDLLTLIFGFIILYVIVKITPFLHEMYVFRITVNKLPQVPPQVPILGGLFMVLTVPREERLWVYYKYALDFKDTIFSGYIVTKAFVTISSPKILEAIIPSTEHIEKSEVYDYAKPWLGNGLLVSAGKRWFHDRKMLTPTFHFNIISQFLPIIWEKAEILVKCFDKELKEKPGHPIDIFPFTIRAAIDVLCETSMGVNMHVQEKTEIEYVEGLFKISELAIYRLFHPWLHPDLFFYASPTGKIFKENVDKMHRLTMEIIRKRRQEREIEKRKLETMTSEDNDIGQKKRKVMLDLLLDISETSEQPLTNDQIREQVDTFLFAGHDTTAAAISWTLFCIGNDPDCQEKVHAELEAVFGDSKEMPTLKQLSDLKYLERVIKESLRLYPSVPVIARMLTKDAIIDGYKVPKGVNIVISPFFTHRHPGFWPDPSKFDPDRFLPENSKDRHPYAYIPFSAGPRNCIGQKFAQMEMRMMIIAVLRKWRVKSALNHDEIKTYTIFILKPNDRLDIYFTEK